MLSTYVHVVVFYFILRKLFLGAKLKALGWNRICIRKIVMPMFGFILWFYQSHVLDIAILLMNNNLQRKCISKIAMPMFGFIVRFYQSHVLDIAILLMNNDLQQNMHQRNSNAHVWLHHSILYFINHTCSTLLFCWWTIICSQNMHQQNSNAYAWFQHAILSITRAWHCYFADEQ